MMRVTIIGTGNVAAVLYKTFTIHKELEVVQVFGRKKCGFVTSDQFARLGQDPIKKAAIYILAISDDSIPLVSELFEKIDGVLVHTSGSQPLKILPKDARKGVFYPLMTLSKHRAVDFKTIPICLEGEHKKDLELLHKLASFVSDKVVEIDSQRRQSLHLAAVFVNNFVNHLYHLGENICLENQVPFDVLLPLIQETAKKIENLSPKEAQTGPARRSDVDTMKKQLQTLKNIDQKDIYTLLSKSIQQTYGEKL